MCSSKVHCVTTHISHLKTILQKSVLKNNITYFKFKIILIKKCVHLKTLNIIFTFYELLHISEI